MPVNQQLATLPIFVQDPTSGSQANVGVGDKNYIYTGGASLTTVYTLSGTPAGGTSVITAAPNYLDTNGFTYVGFQVQQIGTSVTSLTLQQSDDGSTWITTFCYIYSAGGTVGSQLGTGIVAGNYGAVPIHRYMRLVTLNAQTASSTIVGISMRQGAAPPLGTIAATVSGSISPVAGTTGGTLSYIGGVSSGYNGLPSALTSIKAAAGNVYGFDIYNPNAVVEYVGLFNATSITWGTTVPIVWIAVDPSKSKTMHYTVPYGFSACIYIACSSSLTTITAPAVALQGTIQYD